MNEIVNYNNLEIESLDSELNDISTMNSLQKRIDVAEKNNLPLFTDFTDVEMIKWFLYERKHLHLENNRSEGTIREYKREITMFVKQLLTNPVEIDLDLIRVVDGSLFKSLQSRHLRRFQEWLVTKSDYVIRKGAYSPATLERKTTIIKAFFSYLYKVGYIDQPIHHGLLIASVRKDDRPNRDLGPKDVVKLLNTFRNANHPVMFTIIHVLTTTGMRNEEFCTLRIKDLKIDGIQESYYFDVLGKGNKRRHIPLKKKVVESIYSFRRARGLLPVDVALPSDPIFTTSTGKAFSPSYLSQYVKKQILKFNDDGLFDTKITITPHVFRHAFAIISKLNNVDIYDIMRSLGHEKIETTMIYLEKVFEKERHAIHSWDPKVFGQYI